jgi:hypothetical protein
MSKADFHTPHIEVVCLRHRSDYVTNRHRARQWNVAMVRIPRNPKEGNAPFDAAF